MKAAHTPHLVFDKRQVRIGGLLLLPLYVFVALIPLSYTWRAKIPPFETLQVTSGELTYRDVGKRGNRLTGIRTASGDSYFTCAKGTFGAYPDCLFPMNEYERLAGKPAIVWWYEQPVYLFDTQKRLVRLVVAGEEKMSYEKTVRLTDLAARSAPWYLFVMLVSYVAVVVGFEQIIRRQERQEKTTDHSFE